jgi:hypothetical protein
VVVGLAPGVVQLDALAADRELVVGRERARRPERPLRQEAGVLTADPEARGA